MARVRQNPESPAAQLKAMIKNRGWSQADIAYVMGMNVVTVNQMVNGKRAINAEMAKLLGAAFDCRAELFMEMQYKWELDNIPDPVEDVRARADAHARYPLREMAKRGWINSITNVTSSHTELCRFFGVNSLQSIDNLAHAAKKTSGCQVSGEQLVWLYRVRALAREMTVPTYSRDALKLAIDKLAMMREEPEEIRHVAKVLHECGIRFVVVEGLPGGKIDGVCTWLDGGSPVIGMSLRYDRIDNFWFVLRHECSHVFHGHGKAHPIIDSEIQSDAQDVDAEEKVANAEAANFCVPSDKMASFYERKQPLFSERDVRSFAKIHKTHPGIVVGQLQNLSGRYHILRNHLVSVRKHIIASALTDGWGQVVSVD